MRLPRRRSPAGFSSWPAIRRRTATRRSTTSSSSSIPTTVSPSGTPRPGHATTTTSPPPASRVLAVPRRGPDPEGEQRQPERLQQGRQGGPRLPDPQGGQGRLLRRKPVHAGHRRGRPLRGLRHDLEEPEREGASQQAVRYIKSARTRTAAAHYTPRQPGDLFVTGWQVMALEDSRQMAGLRAGQARARP